MKTNFGENKTLMNTLNIEKLGYNAKELAIGDIIEFTTTEPDWDEWMSNDGDHDYVEATIVSFLDGGKGIKATVRDERYDSKLGYLVTKEDVIEVPFDLMDELTMLIQNKNIKWESGNE